MSKRVEYTYYVEYRIRVRKGLQARGEKVRGAMERNKETLAFLPLMSIEMSSHSGASPVSSAPSLPPAKQGLKRVPHSFSS